MWKVSDDADSISTSFFQYTVKLGRHILMRKKSSRISAANFWYMQGMSRGFVSLFWHDLWEREQARKVTAFHWLLVHRAVPVLEWYHRPTDHSICPSCQLASESIRHCLWDCHLAMEVWLRILRILQKVGMALFVSWGSIVWSSLLPQVVQYDSTTGSSTAVAVTPTRIFRVPLDMVHPNPMMERLSKIWELLGSCSMWHIWKARCTRVLSGDIVLIQQVVQGIWSELVFTLKARFDNIKGDSNMSTQKRLSLLKLWDRMEMYSGNHLKVEWSFSPPRWLFPPPIT